MTKDILIKRVSLHTKQYLIAENKPTLVFLHDSLGCIELWRNFPQLLSEATHCNLLVYDRQGYGKSSPFGGSERGNNYLEAEADVLNLLLEKLSIHSAILFGHSDGGSIALITAAKYPEKIKGIITEGAHIFVEEITLQGITETVKAYHTTNLKEKLAKYHSDKTEALFWAWAKTWLTDEFAGWSIKHFLPQIQCPVLVIQGEKDEFGSLAQVNGIVEQVSGKAERFIIPSIGHTPHKEAKEMVLEKAVQFIHQI
jgi:pimeloyl-ACP methyl ester carboxylesterase